MMSKYEIILYWSFDDNAYIAEVPELPGCMADGPTTFDAVKTETGKCFFTIENGMTGELNTWNDLGKLTEQNSGVMNGDSTIKVFTVSELENTSLKNMLNIQKD